MIRLPFALLVFICGPLLGCGQETTNDTTHETNAQAVSQDLQRLFERLDELGLANTKTAKFIEIEFTMVEGPEINWAEGAWLLSEDSDTLTVLRDDLIPWTFQKQGNTTIPESRGPANVQLVSFKEVDFEQYCEEFNESKAPAAEDLSRRISRAHKRLQRIIVAHAAWKRGLPDNCVSILSGNPAYAQPSDTNAAEILKELAWRHFLRGVNLLRYADREEVLPHLRLVCKLSPNADFDTQPEELLAELERLVAKEKMPETIDESKLTDAEKPKFYVAQLRDVGRHTIEERDPRSKLRAIGVAAIPTLIDALDDNTPTRTVTYWRDDHPTRFVSRVSDFAFHILGDITQKEFRAPRVSDMPPQERRALIDEIKAWYAENKDLSREEQMLRFFTSREPEDWLTAGRYFLPTKDKRAIDALREKLSEDASFALGEMCELLAEFEDPSVKDDLKYVLAIADEASDRLSAAIALWKLGDDAGVPAAIDFVRAKRPEYGSWGEPIWFLMTTRREDAIEAIESVIANGESDRAGEVVLHVMGAITGDLMHDQRAPAGCVEICPALLAGMEREEYTGWVGDGVQNRTKDNAAKALVLLREGAIDGHGGMFAKVNPELFDELEQDSAKRDAQIDVLKKWYVENKDRLLWDATTGRLTLQTAND